MDAKDRKPAERTNDREQKISDIATPDADSRATEKVKGGLAGGGDPGKRNQ